MNKTITIYELLGLIKDEQAPERIVYDNYIWSWTGDDYRTILKTEKDQFLITGMYYTWLSEFLDDTVEIIDNNKIEKLPHYSLERIQKAPTKDTWFDERTTLLEKRVNDYHNKINEIIDEINKLKENINER